MGAGRRARDGRRRRVCSGAGSCGIGSKVGCKRGAQGEKVGGGYNASACGAVAGIVGCVSRCLWRHSG